MLERGLAVLTELELKKYMNSVVDEAEVEQAKAKHADAVEAEEAQRKDNESFVQTLDNSLRHGVKQPIANFREKQPICR